MIRRLSALAAALVVSGFAYLLITGRYENEGPVLLQFTQAHGLHAGDLVVAAGWLVAMTALAVLARAPRPEV